MGPKFGVNRAKIWGQWEGCGLGSMMPKVWGQWGQSLGSTGAKIGGQWGQNWGSVGEMWVGVNKPNNADVAVAALLSTYG